MCIVSKKEVDDSPAPRPYHSHSARPSKVIEIRHGSHQSIRVPVRSGQIVRVSSTRGSRVEQASLPIRIPTAVGRTSYILSSDLQDDNYLHPSRSPPVMIHAPTPPQAVSPRVSQTVVTSTTYRERSSPRATQQSLHSHHSHHSSRSRHSGHSRQHSRSGSSAGRRSHADIVDPPLSETYVARTRSDAGQRPNIPSSPPQHPRASMPSVTHERSKSRERTSTGESWLYPDRKTIEQGLEREKRYRIADGQVRGLIGGEDNSETIRIMGRNPRASGGRLGSYGEAVVVVDGVGRRQYGSQ